VISVAQELINSNGSLVSLAGESVETISKQVGIGKDKAATLVAAFELTRRIDFSKRWFSTKKITSPKDVADIFIPLLRNETKEIFFVVCLNSANQIIKYQQITVGLLNSSIVHAREVFKVAIENNSANIILMHNHPSGNIEPSNEDIQITKKLVEAGKILDINVFDHLIIGHSNFTSMVEKRLF
jgi:DNA repair protein RadC